MTKQDIEAFIESQSAMVKKPRTMEKCVMVKGVPWRVLFNSERSRSTLAAVDKASVEARPCFLSEANRFDWQRPLEWRGYDILVNPFPVLPGHPTICTSRPFPVSGSICTVVSRSSVFTFPAPKRR